MNILRGLVQRSYYEILGFQNVPCSGYFDLCSNLVSFHDTENIKHQTYFIIEDVSEMLIRAKDF